MSKRTKGFENDLEAVLQYILESEADDYAVQCEEQGMPQVDGHVYFKAERALERMGDIEFRFADEAADDVTLEEMRIGKAQKFCSEIILKNFEVDRVTEFKETGDQVITMAYINGSRVGVEFDFDIGNATLKSVTLGSLSLKIPLSF